VLGIGVLGLWLAAALTLVTGYDYLKAGLRHMLAEAAPAEPRSPPRTEGLREAESA
jgi:cardiolipin synthase